MTQQENHANADKLSIQKIIFFVNDSVSIRQEATFCVERWRERNVFCTERESFGFSGKCFTGRRCSLLTDKREPERTAVPAGHESPSGAFKPQTGLRSKCRVFSAARSQRFRRAGSDGLRRQLPAGERGRPLRLLPMVAATSPKGRGKKHSRYALGSPFGRAGAKRLRGFVPPQGASASRCHLPLRPFS